MQHEIVISFYQIVNIQIELLSRKLACLFYKVG